MIACLDVGSTFTKGLLVAADGTVLASADHRTTVGTDVLEGVDAVLAALGDADEVLVCSSAGGGLRLAVVGHERAVSAQAGFRAGLSAGARVVHVGSGRMDAAAVRELKASRPDIVLLVGGTDGGDESVLRHNADVLARSGPRVPYVVAGNAVARDDVVAELTGRGREVIAVDNVIPRIGVLDPGAARAALRGLFVTHVIGGKGLSRGRRFASMVRCATPDAVLRGVELLAEAVGDVLVVDVGGATTDVYSVVSADPAAEHVPTEDVAGEWHAARTVEGDLGMRWSAPGVVAAAELEGLPVLLGGAEAAQSRHDDVGLVPASAGERDVDAWLAATAATVAARRHARPAELPGGTRTTARDLRRVRLIVGTGGVLRHGDASVRATVLDPLTGDVAGGWLLPASGTPAVVDERAVLSAAGLLVEGHPETAAALLAASLLG